MPLSVTVEKQSIEVLVNEALAPEARSARIADFARRQIRAADESNRRAFGTVPPKTVTVNGREDDDLRMVPPDSGTIKAHYELVGIVLAWIMDTLRERSPVTSGAYRQGHKLFADDTEVDADNAPAASNYTFLNVVPYARRLEFGKTRSGRPFVIQVPNMIYVRTAADARARFGNAVKISTGFETVPGAWRLKRGSRRRHSHAGDVVKSPAIYVTLR